MQKDLNVQFASLASNKEDKQINSLTQEMQMMWKEIEESFKQEENLDDSLNARKPYSTKSSPVLVIFISNLFDKI